MNKLKNKILVFIQYLLSKSGLLQLAWKNLPNGIYVFNYHRIGNVNENQFDRAVFSCSSQMLDIQVREIKNNFKVITSNDLHQLLQKEKKLTKRYAMVTFDDGYIDNYSEAFPVLKKYNVSGIFYIAANFIGSNKIPFWDEIAYLLRNSCGKEYQLPCSNNKYLLKADGLDKTIRQIIFEAKRLKSIPIIDIVKHMREQFPEAYNALKQEKKRLFMEWHHLAELVEDGMEIGSHTLNHRMLSQLNDEEQQEEIIKSKEIIEEKLSTKVLSIAYPIGRYHCFNDYTRLLSQQAGYQFAFNNEPGKNKYVNDRYNINRICVDSSDLNRFKFSTIFS